MKPCTNCGQSIEDGDKFCPKCGIEQRVKLEILASKKLYKNSLGNIEFRLTSDGVHPITDVSVEASCWSAGEPTDVLQGMPIYAGQTRQVLLRVQPDRGGQDRLDIKVRYRTVDGEDADVERCLCGQAELLISDPNAVGTDGGGQNVSVVVKDVTAVAMGDLMKTGSSIETMESRLAAMWESGEPVWVRVALYAESSPSPPNLKLAIPAPDASPQASARLSVESAKETSAGNLAVFSKPTVAMGRQGENDVRLLVAPLTDPECVEKNMPISRKHLEFRYDGNALSVVDLGSGNGTYLAGSMERLPKDEAAAVDDGATINVAGVVEMCADSSARSEADEMLDARGRIVLPWSDREASGLPEFFGLQGDAAHDWLRLSRGDCADQYLVLVSSATMGRGADCAWVLDHPTGEQQHARLVYHSRRYWLQPLTDTALTTADGVRLGPLDVVVLHDGMKLVLGDLSVNVAVVDS